MPELVAQQIRRKAVLGGEPVDMLVGAAARNRVEVGDRRRRGDEIERRACDPLRRLDQHYLIFAVEAQLLADQVVRHELGGRVEGEVGLGGQHEIQSARQVGR